MSVGRDGRGARATTLPRYLPMALARCTRVRLDLIHTHIHTHTYTHTHTHALYYIIYDMLKTRQRRQRQYLVQCVVKTRHIVQGT